MWLLKLQFDQNSIKIYLKSNDNFKNYIMFGETKKKKKKMLEVLRNLYKKRLTN
jgi:hypothetical protein